MPYKLDFTNLEDLTMDLSDMDDFSSVHAAPVAAAAVVPCPSCSGSGAWRSPSGMSRGPCFTCEGRGSVDPMRIKRQSAARKGRATAESNRAAQESSWRRATPDAAAWIDEPREFDFRIAMREALKTYGGLTDGQLLAVRRCIASDLDRRAQWAAERVTAAAAAPQLGDAFLAIKEALDKAARKGLRAPTLRTSIFVFSRAKDSSANPGAIYIKARSRDVYLGKILDGRFCASRECSAADTAALVVVADDPLAAAVAYGREFGICSCCGRDLSDPASVAAGIGPVCALKFFG